MKKRIAALILACVLMTVPVLAAENTADNFTRTRTYAGEFSDLTSDSPFYENVTALYEYGLTVGKGDGTFGLTDTMTVGQIVIFAGRIHSLYRTGDPEAGAAAQGGDGTTAVYAIPADTLTGLNAYGNDPRDSLLCIPMYSKNADSAAALIELMLEKLR